ncbi:MAG: protoporphyrinogen oxidase [Desulfobulbaceae bacterium BRH_c16a]|nr:MAG: protoporphyrinogen oxidase [Desulfobulbaceae bacterium BRH_c16a]
MNEHYQTLIIGGGISGLTIAHKLRLQKPGHRFLVLEKGQRTGGVIASHRDQGYITEIGPHGFLDNCPESRQILTETGLDRECLKAPLIDFVRYVRLNGRLNLIPQTPRKILMAPLIPWSAKLRVLAELWQPVLQGEPTVAKWVAHRFGPALLPYLDAVYTGTYAGDFDRLTIDSVMPGIRALEKEHGSVLRGLLHKLRQNKKERAASTPLRMPAMTSFPEGMQRLPERLAENLRQNQDLLLSTEVIAVQPAGNGWQVETSKGRFQAADVVFALPINAALRLLANIDPSLPEKAVPEAWIATVVLGFKDTVRLPPGFGFLTPERERRFALGALFSSNMFPGRAPAGHIVFETLVGGRRHPERLELDDRTLTGKAFDDVREILNIRSEPVYTTVLRSNGAIPQLERNYPTLLAWRKKLLASYPGLHICGFGWEGIGLNDMMKSASRVAEEILSSAGRIQKDADIKGVYF